MDARLRLRDALAGRRVLIVEGDPEADGSLAGDLARLGVETEVASSGPEALLRLARGDDSGRGAIGLVVLAAGLGGMGAAGLARALKGRTETRGLPVVTVAGAPVDAEALVREIDAQAATPELDLTALGARVGLSPTDMADMLRAFAPQLEAHLAALAGAAAAADAETARREAHALAGAAGNLGGAAVHRAARALEQAARHADADLTAPTAEVAREGRALLAAIATLGAATPPASPALADEPPTGELSESLVLIVDDVPANVDLLVRALRHDYHLAVAYDGESALRSVAARLPDLILLDVMMPGLDGHEVCRRLKRDPATHDVPVVFLTSLDEIADKAAGFEVGAADYVTKPFEVLEVKARVRALLRARAYQEAMRRLLENELRVAREIQRGLLPQDFGALGLADTADCFACLEPAREVGGDLYDVFRLDERRICLAVGDVSGKGIPAALFMVMTVTLIRSLARQWGRPDEILARLNDALAADNPSCMFVTIFCAVLELDTGRLIYASGGHPSPFLVREGAPPRPAVADLGTLVGVLPGLAFPAAELYLGRGDLLVAFTDGVTEAQSPDGAFFGDEPVQALLADARGATSKATLDSILAAVRRFEGGAERSDDIALLAVRYAGPSRPADDVVLDLAATLPELGRAAATIDARCEAAGLAREATNAILLALDELVANTIRHGYPDDPSGWIRVILAIDDETASLEIRDRAPAFDPTTAPPPDLSLPLDERPDGKVGLHLTREVVDRMDYARVDDENRVRVTRRRARRE